MLRAIDKLDRLENKGVRALLGKGRTDESGDYTKGAELDDAQIEILNALSELVGRMQRARNSDTLEQLSSVFAENETFQSGVAELKSLTDLTDGGGGYEDRIRIDPSVVRGLEYYTGPVFEAELTSPIKDERGQPIRLGAVVSGGRYDGLVERFTGEKVPATGISIGVSRLLFGLQLLGKYKGSAAQGPVVVLVLDRDRLADYQKIAQTLRQAGIRAELYLGESGMKAQMKYADRRGGPCVVIQGSDERAKGEVTIKDLILGATLTETKDRAEYLKKQAEAQFSVPEADLVEEVRRVIARHKA